MKCIPCETERQRIENLQIKVMQDSFFQMGKDAFGNSYIYGNLYEAHRDLELLVSGVVVTGLSGSEAEVSKTLSPALYLYCGRLTKPEELIRDYYYRQPYEKGPDTDSLRWAVSRMHGLHKDFRYEKNVTKVNTTAEEAFAMGSGVCQDYAHILLSLCRLAGIPARYVCGMMIGEGYSHAWVEVFCKGRWYALDPTNDTVAADSYIKLGVGRDAKDCLINHGIVLGGGKQLQEIHVTVREIST